MTNNNTNKKIVVLGTGGTIAGTATRGEDNIGYTAAQVPVGDLLAAIPALRHVLGDCLLVSEQLAQIDSKDMDFEVWRRLALSANHHLAQPDVAGVIITHGTDTLEETAYFLHAVLPPQQRNGKPIVLTCAMRPASSAAPDGPQNLMDAVSVVLAPGACGVLVVCAGAVHGAVEVQKVHTYRVDAFNSGDSGPLAYVEEGAVRLTRNWPFSLWDEAQVAIEKIAMTGEFPRVEIVMSYAGANGAMVDALVNRQKCNTMPGQMQEDAPIKGLVVAATGNGSIHQSLESALLRAQDGGIQVVRATRCTNGRVLPVSGQTIPDSQGLSPVKARIALMLALMP